MGQRIEKKRKISADRVRKIRKPKNNILIAVEGKNKTEKLYFNNFDDGKQPYSIIFARGNFTDPLNLVKMLIKEIKILGLNLKYKYKMKLDKLNDRIDKIVKLNVI